MSKLFNGLENIDWVRLWYVLGIVLTVWVGLAAILPIELYRIISVILSAIQAGITFAMRGGKFVSSRHTLPPESLDPVTPTIKPTPPND